MSVSVYIDHRESTPHSTIETGRIEFGEKTVIFRDEKPNELTSSETLLSATGLAAGIESLSCASRRYSELGLRALSVGHTHHDVRHPIRSNAEDIEAVSELVSGDDKIHAVGLSRGFPAQVLATKHLPGKINSLTAVAPAMMAPINPLRVARIGVELVSETAMHPKDFGRVIIDCLKTVKDRPDVTISEVLRLTVGNVHKRVTDLREQQQELDLHLVASFKDCFFDEKVLEALAIRLGFDTFSLHRKGSAGHAAYAYSPELAEGIFRNVTTYDKPKTAA